jgi:hypothetical protein
MSLLTYESARPWAKAIKNAVLQRKMPPWFASLQYGHFTNDKSLKQADLDTVAKWVDSGAPEGDPKEAPVPLHFADGGWMIQPDLIVEGPTYNVPAKGIVEWQWIPVPGNFTKDTWVTSVEVMTEQPSVTHHICLSFRPHSPDIKYGVPVFNKPNIERDAEGVEIRKPGSPFAQQQGGASNSATAGFDSRTISGAPTVPSPSRSAKSSSCAEFSIKLEDVHIVGFHALARRWTRPALALTTVLAMGFSSVGFRFQTASPAMKALAIKPAAHGIARRPTARAGINTIGGSDAAGALRAS